MTAARVELPHTLWLSAALLLTAAPHAPRMPWWLAMIVVALVYWRIHIARARLALPRRLFMIAAILGTTIAIYLHFRTLFGRDAGVALLIAMLALKLLETRTRRDGMLLVFLGYFLVITNFLYSQSIPTALYMILCVWLITAAMTALNYTTPHPGYRRELKHAGLLLAQSVPLMLVLFLFFPRVPGPLWGLPRDAYGGMSGLSDFMSPGSVANLSLSDAVAFRVEFSAAPPEPRRMYWRGPVMWDFDGYAWTLGRPTFRTSPQFDAFSRAVDYTVTLEPHNQRWLFALDLPARIPPRAGITSDFQLRSTAPVTARMRYDMRSYLDYRFGAEESAAVLARARRLPQGANPRTLALAAALRRKAADDHAYVREVLSMFRNEKFFYTLAPPPLRDDPVDDFLFRTRSGFCEHYASAFTVLLRAAGIPARVVTGYQGGEINPIGHYLIVRQADAHAWTEAWFPGEGWVRIDPTAAVSPLRIQSGIAAAVPRTDPLPLFVRDDYPRLRELRFTLDSLANTWNQWVLGYNGDRQRAVLSRVGVDQATWRALTVVLVIATALVLVMLAPLLLRSARGRTHDPVRRAYLKFCAKLERKGLRREPAEGPLNYAARLATRRPDLASRVAAITRLYVSLRYGKGVDAAGVRTLQQEVERFRA